MSNTVTTNALAQLNKDRQAKVTDEAQAKITYLLREQATIKSCQESIKVHQDAVKLLVEDVLTAESVFGRPASVTPTQNEVTILNAIKERNDAKQKSIEANSKSHLGAITEMNATITACNARIATLREELSKLAADVVTETQVLG